MLRDKVAGATLMSGLFFLCIILAYFPQLYSIKAFSVDVQLRKSLDRAQEILESFRSLSIVSARATYFTIAWSNRLGGMPAKEQQKLLDSVDLQLRAIGVKDTEKDDIARPYVELIGYDLYHLYYRTARIILIHRRAEPSEVEGTRRLTDWEQQWRPVGVEALRSHLGNGTALGAYVKRQISPATFGEDDFRRLDKFIDKMAALFDECVKRAGYTEEALTFSERYASAPQGPDEYYRFFLENN